MFRVLGLLLVTLALPSCAIAPSPSVFASLNGQGDDAPRRAAARAAAPAPQKPVQEAGLGSWWNSVKSNFGADDGGKPPTAALQGPGLDPAAAAKLVNSYRAQKGLKPLKLNTRLSEAARKHSEDLAKSDRISHYGSDGSDAWDRVRKTGYGARITAENVGTGQQSLEEVFRGWQKSKDHNANLLLGDAEELGIAVVYKPDSQFKTFWTMVVASPRIR
jgi:uncharacterized protein YkwD